jgi:aspartyl-tRNA(Asn)/glutamyl-tRNA(Gln) amidotransferase subunit C
MFGKKEIERLAFFARIKLNEEELQNAPKEVEDVLKYVQKISDVETENVEPLFHFSEIRNIVREDVAKPVDKEVTKKMMSMGKEQDGYLKVESIL